MIADRFDQSSFPQVLMVGTEDVDMRIELMQELRDEFTLAAAGTSPALGRRFEDAGFEYFHYPLPRGTSPARDLYGFVALLRLLRRLRPTVVHSFDSKPCVYARLAARLAGVPVVVGTIPGLGSLYVDEPGRPDGFAKRLVRRIYEMLQKRASHSADLTIFQNRIDAEEFLAKGVVPRKKQTIVPGSGVRTGHFDPRRISQAERQRVRASLGVPDDAVLVTMISRVIRTKGVEEYALAAAQVRRHHPNAHFLLVGPADEKSLDRLSPQEIANLRAAVNWPGPRSDIPQVLAASDLFVLPTFYREGIPRVLLEAASMGLPLVATCSPGCVEVVEEGVNGHLVPVRNPTALAAAIDPLVSDADARASFGAESRWRAVDRFDLTVIAQRTRSIYRDLLAARRVERGPAPDARQSDSVAEGVAPLVPTGGMR
jgi:glycosyltransferase involved in cell wall biosynthesis